MQIPSRLPSLVVAIAALASTPGRAEPIPFRGELTVVLPSLPFFVTVEGSGVGSFALTPAGGGGTMPIAGALRLRLLAACNVADTILSLPLGVVGAGGSAGVAGPPSVTLAGAPWTKGRVTISNPGLVTVVSGFEAGPAMQAGTTAQVGGTLELVTPLRVRSSLPGFDDIGAFALLHLELVPEPASGMLLAAGVFALAASRRRR